MTKMMMAPTSPATPCHARRHRGPTNDDRGQCLKFPADAGGRVGAALPGRVKDFTGGAH